MASLLCADDSCRIPRRHNTDCTNPDCGGCLKAQAADGLRLCWHDASRLAPNAVEAATLHAELAFQLAGSSSSSGLGTIGQKNPGHGINLNPHVAEHRATIRQTLVAITTRIAEERGHTLPWKWGPWELIPLDEGVHGPLARRRTRTIDHSTARLGSYIADNHQWLAAHEEAGQFATELGDLVATGRSLRQASGTRIIEVGPCPQKTHHDDDTVTACPGKLRALLRLEASLLPSEVHCDADEDHIWDSTQWMKLGRTMSRSTT